MQILNLDDFTEQTIKDIIDNSLEESINIEFKSALALSKETSVKKEISKDVSAFANSDGGIIFYGINENNHVASSVSFIDGRIFTKEWLENIIISSIQPKIADMIIYPIRFDMDIARTVYVVKIPRSTFSPHINADKKYYRRFNFQSVPMEEYEIRNLYLRQRESKVYSHGIIVKPVPEKDRYDDDHSFYIELQIANEGYYVAEKYKAACNFTNALGIGIIYDRTKNYSVTNKIGEEIKISNNDNVPLFPNEIFNALHFTLAIPKNEFNELVANIKFSILIYNVTDLDVIEMDISHLLMKTKEKYYE